VWDHDLLADDKIIGRCVVSLLPVFRKGELDTWVAMKTVGGFGGNQAAGQVHLQV
jgi:hypothetical protein